MLLLYAYENYVTIYMILEITPKIDIRDRLMSPRNSKPIPGNNLARLDKVS